MAKASDNPFPSTLLVEGTAPTSPASGNQRLFIDSSDHKLKRVNSSGTVTQVESAGGGLTAITEVTTPSTPGAGTQTLFIDSSDHHLKRINSSGTVTDLEAGGGGGSVLSYFAQANGSADQNPGGATAFVDITGVTLSVPAASGDVLFITATASLYSDAGGRTLDLGIVVAGNLKATNVAVSPTTNFPLAVATQWNHTVASGDISGGNVAVKVMARTSAGGLWIINSSARIPNLSVLNLGQ